MSSIASYRLDNFIEDAHYHLQSLCPHGSTFTARLGPKNDEGEQTIDLSFSLSIFKPSENRSKIKLSSAIDRFISNTGLDRDFNILDEDEDVRIYVLPKTSADIDCHLRKSFNL